MSKDTIQRPSAAVLMMKNIALEYLEAECEHGRHLFLFPQPADATKLTCACMQFGVDYTTKPVGAGR